jgi:hypothetical protein
MLGPATKQVTAPAAFDSQTSIACKLVTPPPPNTATTPWKASLLLSSDGQNFAVADTRQWSMFSPSDVIVFDLAKFVDFRAAGPAVYYQEVPPGAVVWPGPALPGGAQQIPANIFPVPPISVLPPIGFYMVGVEGGETGAPCEVTVTTTP